MTNYLKTGLLLLAMTFLFMAIGFLLGGQTGMTIAFVVAVGMNFFSYYNSDKMLLRMHDAHEVGPHDGGNYYRIVERLAQRAGLPMPKVYIMDNAQPNAFATGRNPEHAAVAATSGLIRMLTDEELAGVMAHELAHVKNRDMLIMTMTATIAGAIGLLAQFGMMFGSRDNRPNLIVSLALMFLAPMAASLVQMAISRTREYQADRMGAEISGNPLALASALNKISGAAHEIPNETAEENPATAHLFIINPLSGKSMDRLFSTHPNTENRIAALIELAEQMGTQQAGGNSYSGQQYGGGSDRYAKPDDYYARTDTLPGNAFADEDEPARRRERHRTGGVDPANPWGEPEEPDPREPADDYRKKGPWG